MTSDELYRPPAPTALSPLRSLLRVIRQGDGDLLSLVPREAYREPLVWLGYSRRSILLVNSPELCRDVLIDKDEIFPKNDLMVGALEGLIGDSLFVSSGDTWRRQRRMVDPVFSHIRINTAFRAMVAAVDDFEAKLDALIDGEPGVADHGVSDHDASSEGISRRGTSSPGASSQAASSQGTPRDGASGHESSRQSKPVSLDLMMSQLTADVICRTIFSIPLHSQTAQDVFDDFLLFERSVASVNLRQLIIGKPWADIRQPAPVVAACQRIRKHIGDLLEPRLAPDAKPEDDIVQAIIDARDEETGKAFSREELIDQTGVFFIAGHETTASVLTWVFFILSMRPDVAARIRDEVARVVGDGPVEFDHISKLPYLKNVFRETLRLYPPITFIPRVALKATTIGDKSVKRGAMIMISPWTAHRNEALWSAADRFDPSRFDTNADAGAHADAVASEGADGCEHARRGVQMSFGLGPRVCVGATFATAEAVLFMARLCRRYTFETVSPDAVRPVARLTTRPAEEIYVRVARTAA